jgi:hypothetical protein
MKDKAIAGSSPAIAFGVMRIAHIPTHRTDQADIMGYLLAR